MDADARAEGASPDFGPVTVLVLGAARDALEANAGDRPRSGTVAEDFVSAC